jgi:aminoglycoside 6'-N-acetyltransferase I
LSDITIRTAHPDEFALILALATAFYREDGFTTAAWQLRDNLRALLQSDSARVAVADSRDNDIVGFAVTTLSFGLEQGLVAELEDLFVKPAYRRTGIGGVLIDDSAAWAGSRGCRVLELVVAPNGNDVAHLFSYYARRGFADEDRRILSRALASSD